jgi:hypothetical protein
MNKEQFIETSATVDYGIIETSAETKVKLGVHTRRAAFYSKAEKIRMLVAGKSSRKNKMPRRSSAEWHFFVIVAFFS